MNQQTNLQVLGKILSKASDSGLNRINQLHMLVVIASLADKNGWAPMPEVKKQFPKMSEAVISKLTKSCLDLTPPLIEVQRVSKHRREKQLRLTEFGIGLLPFSH